MKKFLLIGGIIIVGIALTIGNTVMYHRSAETIKIKVTGKDRITQSDGDGNSTSKYLVFTTTEKFENTDVMTLGKYNSSDIQGRLREDSTYTVKVYGWRIPWMSSYRNIVEIKK